MKLRKKKNLLFKFFTMPLPLIKNFDKILILKETTLKKYKYIYEFICSANKLMLRLKKETKKSL
jgi:hypothetical protein